MTAGASASAMVCMHADHEDARCMNAHPTADTPTDAHARAHTPHSCSAIGVPTALTDRRNPFRRSRPRDASTSLRDFAPVRAAQSQSHSCGSAAHVCARLRDFPILCFRFGANSVGCCGAFTCQSAMVLRVSLAYCTARADHKIHRKPIAAAVACSRSRCPCPSRTMQLGTANEEQQPQQR